MYRARESDRVDAVFRDPYAKHIGRRSGIQIAVGRCAVGDPGRLAARFPGHNRLVQKGPAKMAAKRLIPNEVSRRETIVKNLKLLNRHDRATKCLPVSRNQRGS